MTSQTLDAKLAFKQELKENFQLSLPLSASWLVYSMSGFIGTAIVARLGSDALAASVLVSSIWTALSVFFFGIFSSLGVIVAQHKGARNYAAISSLMGQAFKLGLVALLPIMLAIALVPTILHFTKQDQHVLQLATRYAHALLWSVPGIVYLVILEHFLNGIGKAKISLWVSLLEVPIEIVLIYCFVFGKYGFPTMGIAGVGYGLATSFGLTSILLMIYLYRAPFAQKYQLFARFWHYERQYVREIIKVGLPIGLMYLIEVTAFTAATFLMGRFSTLTLAAHQIAIQYLSLTINIAYAIAQATSIRIGQMVGKQNAEGIRYAAMVGITLGMGVMILISLGYMLFDAQLLRLDLQYPLHGRDILLAKEAASFLLVLGIYQIFDSLRILETGIFRGLKITKLPMYISIISFWLLGLGSGVLFAFVWHDRGIGLWLGLTLGAAGGTLMLFIKLTRTLQLPSLQALLIARAKHP